MLPKWHVIYGAIFSIFTFYLFDLSYFQAMLIFLSSVFIDVDHYFWFIQKKQSFNLREAYIYHKNLPRDHKPIMQIFHSAEFLTMVLILSFFWNVLFFILIGMIFHSILDIIEMSSRNRINSREFSFLRYLARDKSNYL
jgi:hypothetical protein